MHIRITWAALKRRDLGLLCPHLLRNVDIMGPRWGLTNNIFRCSLHKLKVLSGLSEGLFVAQIAAPWTQMSWKQIEHQKQRSHLIYPKPSSSVVHSLDAKKKAIKNFWVCLYPVRGPWNTMSSKPQGSSALLKVCLRPLNQRTTPGMRSVPKISDQEEGEGTGRRSIYIYVLSFKNQAPISIRKSSKTWMIVGNPCSW